MAGGGRKLFSAFALIFFLALLGFAFIVALASLFTPSDGLLEAPFSDNKIALVRIEGAIMDGDDIIRQIRRYTENDSVKAIVLRIVSPGGAVAPSQEIYSEVKKAGRKKPVITSMGTVAASGGYYIASATRRIFADPGTITGSIGVIMMFSNLEKLMGKLGLGSVVFKSGKFKDTGSPYRPFSDDEKKLMQNVIADVYDQFINDVAKGRKMGVEQVRKLADGRIYTGRQALGHNLIDELGSMQDAISAAAKMAGITTKPDIIEQTGDNYLLKLLLGEDFEMRIPGQAGLSSGIYYLWPAW